MQQNVREMWRKVIEARESLSGAEHHCMTSLPDGTGGKGGLVTQMATEPAARAIARGQARLATNAEIKAADAETAKARDAIAKAESLRLRNDLFSPHFTGAPAAPEKSDK